jgi:hypothetical protein
VPSALLPPSDFSDFSLDIATGSGYAEAGSGSKINISSSIFKAISFSVSIAEHGGLRGRWAEVRVLKRVGELSTTDNSNNLGNRIGK